MKQLKLIRTTTSEQGTFGTLIDIVDSKQSVLCVTGELPKYAGNPNIENERNTDCIPVGTYICKIKYSPKFKQNLYRLEQVPNRSEILIHVGNYSGERPKYKSDVEGCILLGTKIGVLSNQKAVLNSRVAFNKFMKYTNNKSFELTIIEKF